MRGAVAFCTCVRYPRNPCLCIWARISRGINQSFYKCFSKKHPERSEHFQYHVAVPMAVNFKTKGKFSLQSYFFSKYLFSDKKLKTSFRGLGFLHLYWLADFFRDSIWIRVRAIYSLCVYFGEESLFIRKKGSLGIVCWSVKAWTMIFIITFASCDLISGVTQLSSGLAGGDPWPRSPRLLWLITIMPDLWILLCKSGSSSSDFHRTAFCSNKAILLVAQRNKN